MSGGAKKGYEYQEERRFDHFAGVKSGPHYTPTEECHAIGEMPVLCGICGRQEFKVYSLTGEYSTWCVCACGNKFEIHSG
jgi:hypothetical protein